MTTVAGDAKYEKANELRKEGQYSDAADEYAAAAYEYLGEHGLEHSLSAARGLKALAVGAICLRLSGDLEGAENLCWQGVYISESIAAEAQSRPPASHSHDQSERLIWYEFEADFRTIGGHSGREDAYDRVEQAYRDVGDPACASCEQFHMSVAAPMKLLVYGTGLDEEPLHAVLEPPAHLTEWIEFKRTHLPTALDSLNVDDEWTYVF